MLLCDDEPSPESSDEVFFFCEEHMNVKCDDSNDSNCKNKYNSKVSAIDQTDGKLEMDELKHKKNSQILNRKRNKKIIVDSILPSRCDVASGPDENNHSIIKKSVGLGTKDEDTQTGHTILVKIQVENCAQCPDNSISVFSHETATTPSNDSQCKLKNKTVAVQVNFNSTESVVESHCVKISKVRCCNKSSRGQNIKATKCNVESVENDVNSSDSTKVYLWNGKNRKNHLSLKTTSTTEKPKLQDKSHSVDRASMKNKKSFSVSPLKKFNRSSLTIGSDNINVNQSLNCCNIRAPFPANLSKYSPCASRLAASSKILGNTSPTALSPESPLHVSRPKSPRVEDSLTENSSKNLEKMTLQASLSLNIHQLKKSHLATPRSRSVGDSCVTSPTSEATTLSYSPTGTEILSLEEVGQQIPVTNSVSLSALDLKTLHNDKLSTPINVRKANLETKC